MEKLEVLDKYNDTVLEVLDLHDMDKVREIVETAVRGRQQIRDMPAWRKRDAFLSSAEAVAKKKREIALLISSESGKPLKNSLTEVDRAITNLNNAASEAVHHDGSVIPMDTDSRGDSYLASWKRVPLGTVLGITPFNDPLNMAAHKVLPALASGNSAILKPSTLAPISAITLAGILRDSGFPEESVQTLIARGDSTAMSALFGMDEISMISFTGSYETAGSIFRSSVPRKITMELGGNCPVIVWDDSDLDVAAEKVCDAAFESQGQNCIHTQRIILSNEVEEYFTNRMIEITSGLRVGDPHDISTDIGPMISESKAVETAGTILESVEDGGELVSGGQGERRFIRPTIVRNVSRKSRLWMDEIFAPVCCISLAKSLNEAIDLANDTSYGLQAGIFTSDLNVARIASEKLDFGTVLINETSDFRIDSMPFGGMKRSGFGREGMRYAMDEMSTVKLTVIRE